MQVDLEPDLTLTVGDAATRLTPGGAFRLAERLLGLDGKAAPARHWQDPSVFEASVNNLSPFKSHKSPP
jgi:hypothetical protein